MIPFRLFRQLAGSLGQAIGSAVLMIGGLIFLAMILFFMFFIAIIVGILLYLPLRKKRNKGLALGGIPIILWGGVVTAFSSDNEQFPWVGALTLAVGLVMYIVGFKQATSTSASPSAEQVIEMVPSQGELPTGLPPWVRSTSVSAQTSYPQQAITVEATEK